MNDLDGVLMQMIRELCAAHQDLGDLRRKAVDQENTIRSLRDANAKLSTQVIALGGEDTSREDDQVKRIVAAHLDRKFEGIREIRHLTGMSLKDARETFERYAPMFRRVQASDL